MPTQMDLDRANDRRFQTPLLLVPAIVACGILHDAYNGHALAAA